jgi:hypothetical protein
MAIRTHESESIADQNGVNDTNAAAATLTTTSRGRLQQRRTLNHENDVLRQMLKDSSAQNSQALQFWTSSSKCSWIFSVRQ